MKTLKLLSSLPILMQNHSGGDRVALGIISFFLHLLGYFFFSFLLFFFFFAKHILVGHLFRNIHPSLQYSSRSRIHTSLYDFFSHMYISPRQYLFGDNSALNKFNQRIRRVQLFSFARTGHQSNVTKLATFVSVNPDITCL